MMVKRVISSTFYRGTAGTGGFPQKKVFNLSCGKMTEKYYMLRSLRLPSNSKDFDLFADINPDAYLVFAVGFMFPWMFQLLGNHFPSACLRFLADHISINFYLYVEFSFLSVLAEFCF